LGAAPKAAVIAKPIKPQDIGVRPAETTSYNIEFIGAQPHP
jgi:hypothetical protein